MAAVRPCPATWPRCSTACCPSRHRPQQDPRPDRRSVSGRAAQGLRADGPGGRARCLTCCLSRPAGVGAGWGWRLVLLSLIALFFGCVSTATFGVVALTPGPPCWWWAWPGCWPAAGCPRRKPEGALEAAKWRAFRRYLLNLEDYGTQAEAQEILDRHFAYAVALDVARGGAARRRAAGAHRCPCGRGPWSCPAGSTTRRAPTRCPPTARGRLLQPATNQRPLVLRPRRPAGLRISR